MTTDDEKSGIDFYYSGPMMIVRVDCLDFSDKLFTDDNTQCVLMGDIRLGLLVNTESGNVQPIVYTHSGLISAGYLFGSTEDLADTKLAALCTLNPNLSNMRSLTEEMFDA